MRFRICFLLSFVLFATIFADEDKQTINIGMVYDFTSLDPALVQTSDDFEYSVQLHEGLTTQNPRTFELSPGSAYKWDRSEDGYEYTFYLRENLKWSDGTPLTSEDFKFAWIRALDEKTKSGYASLLYTIKNGEAYAAGTVPASEVGIDAEDTHILKVTLEQPVVYFINLTSLPVMAPVPRHLISEDNKNWAAPENIITNGPFSVNKIDTKQKVLYLKKNPHYWDKDMVHLEEVIYHFHLEHDKALEMYQNGELDINHHTNWEDIQQYASHKEAYRYPLLGTFFLRLNTTDPILSDKRVRKALYLTVNRSIICREILQGGEFPTYSLIPTRIPGYTNILGDRENTAKARRLLAEAGYPDGEGFPPLTISYNNFSNNNVVAQGLSEIWKKELNIEIQFDQVEKYKDFISQVKSLNYQIARSSWIGDYLDPSTFFDIFETADGGNNRTGWKNDRYTRLIQSARKETDPAKREQFYNEAEAILIDEVPIIPVYHYVNMYLKKPYVVGVYPSMQDIVPLKEVYIKK